MGIFTHRSLIHFYVHVQCMAKALNRWHTTMHVVDISRTTSSPGSTTHFTTSHNVIHSFKPRCVGSRYFLKRLVSYSSRRYVMIMTADLRHVGMIGVTCRCEIKAETGKNCRRLPLRRASVDLNDVFLPVSSRARCHAEHASR